MQGGRTFNLEIFKGYYVAALEHGDRSANIRDFIIFNIEFKIVWVFFIFLHFLPLTCRVVVNKNKKSSINFVVLWCFCFATKDDDDASKSIKEKKKIIKDFTQN